MIKICRNIRPFQKPRQRGLIIEFSLRHDFFQCHIRNAEIVCDLACFASSGKGGIRGCKEVCHITAEFFLDLFSCPRLCCCAHCISCRSADQTAQNLLIHHFPLFLSPKLSQLQHLLLPSSLPARKGHTRLLHPTSGPAPPGKHARHF